MRTTIRNLNTDIKVLHRKCSKITLDVSILFLKFSISVCGHNKDIRGEFGNSAHDRINSHTCRWIACIIATMLLLVGKCFTVLSNKFD